jgi:hypothetical protein
VVLLTVIGLAVGVPVAFASRKSVQEAVSDVRSNVGTGFRSLRFNDGQCGGSFNNGLV